MPGRHVTDHQMRLFMQHRQTDTVAVAAAKASMSRATGYRIAKDPRLPSMHTAPRGRRRPDPLADVFEAEVVPNPSKSPLGPHGLGQAPTCHRLGESVTDRYHPACEEGLPII